MSRSIRGPSGPPSRPQRARARYRIAFIVPSWFDVPPWPQAESNSSDRYLDDLEVDVIAARYERTYGTVQETGGLVFKGRATG